MLVDIPKVGGIIWKIWLRHYQRSLYIFKALLNCANCIKKIRVYVYVHGYIKAFGLRTQIPCRNIAYKPSIIKSTWCITQFRLTIGQAVYKTICSKFRKNAKFAKNRELFFFKPNIWLAVTPSKGNFKTLLWKKDQTYSIAESLGYWNFQ